MNCLKEMQFIYLDISAIICLFVCFLLPLTLKLKGAKLHIRSESRSYETCGEFNEQKIIQRDDIFECHFSFST